MKKIIGFIILAALGAITLNAQTPWYLIGNAPVIGNFLGTTNAQSLQLKTEASQPINLYTSAGVGTFNTGRLTIKGSYVGTSGNGLIGIGDMGTNCAFLPQNLLHQHTTSITRTNFHQFTNPATGSGANNGFLFGQPANSLTGEIRQQEDAPIIIYTGNLNAAQMLERMRFTTGLGGDGVGNWNTISNATKINISSGGIATVPFNFPVACLNIGYDLPGNASGGRRPWMDIGTYYSSNSDHMYTGLLDMGSNRKDAIVNFGDDPQYNAFDNSVQNPENIRGFIYFNTISIHKKLHTAIIGRRAITTRHRYIIQT